MDINMPDMDDTELCAIVKEKYPGIFVLGLSTLNQGIYIKKMMENGVSGYVLKTVDSPRKNLLAKLDVKNTATLIRLAIEQKLI